MSSPFNLTPWFTIVLTRISSVFEELISRPAFLDSFQRSSNFLWICRQPKTYVKPEAAITVIELLITGGVSLETCWAIKKHWNNKLYYMVASCWLFLLVLKYIGVVNVVVWLHMLSGPCWYMSAALFGTWLWKLSLWYNLKLRKSHNGPLSCSLTVFSTPTAKVQMSDCSTTLKESMPPLE